MCAELCQPRLTLCDPMDHSPQSPLSLRFSRWEYWSGLPCSPPGDLLDLGIEPVSLMSTSIGRQVLYHYHHLENPFYRLFSSVQSLSRVWLFATPWNAAHQASLSITNSWSLFKLMSIESVMPFNHLILCHLLLLLPSILPTSGSFQMSQLFTSGGQSVGVSASAAVLPMNIQDWFPLGWTGWISL